MHERPGPICPNRLIAVARSGFLPPPGQSAWLAGENVMFDSVVESGVTRGVGGGDWAIPGGLGLCGTAGGVVVFAGLGVGRRGIPRFFHKWATKFQKGVDRIQHRA